MIHVSQKRSYILGDFGILFISIIVEASDTGQKHESELARQSNERLSLRHTIPNM